MPPSTQHPVLCIATDGMDQAKWSLPRFRNLRACKAISSFKRPRLKVQAVWVYWSHVDFWILDPDQPHDSSSVCECIARSLERLRLSCSEKGVPVPTELCLWVRLLVEELFFADCLLEGLRANIYTAQGRQLLEREQEQHRPAIPHLHLQEDGLHRNIPPDAPGRTHS